MLEGEGPSFLSHCVNMTGTNKYPREGAYFQMQKSSVGIRISLSSIMSIIYSRQAVRGMALGSRPLPFSAKERNNPFL